MKKKNLTLMTKEKKYLQKNVSAYMFFRLIVTDAFCCSALHAVWIWRR